MARYNKMIGDGQFPNLYWVTTSNDFYVCKNGICDIANGVGIKYKSKSKTYPKAFKTFGKALDFAEELIENIPDTPTPKSINNVTIEDRISGQVYECSIYAYPVDGLLKNYEIHIERHNQSDFTKQIMEAAGKKFE